MTNRYRSLAWRPGQAYCVSSGAQVDTEAEFPDSSPAIARDDAKWIPVRKAKPVNVILPVTRRWLAMLVPDVHPQALATKFPRLANGIAANWGSPEMCRSLLYRLLVDQRGNRQGFPKDVTRDILSLWSFYGELHPAAEDESSTLQNW